MDTKKLVLPKGNSTEEIETIQSILFVGANGSGKTRLGTWIEIESNQKSLVHRISAQKSLSLPDSTTPQSIERAEKDLLFGNPDWTFQHKQNKWQQKPATTFLNDYQKLMVYLFSDETEENAKFKRQCKERSKGVKSLIYDFLTRKADMIVGRNSLSLVENAKAIPPYDLIAVG